MPRVTDTQLEQLRPYLQGDSPRENGEWDCQCPLHEDDNRSASVNVKTGLFCCYKNCWAGPVSALIRRRSDWLPPSLGMGRSGGGWSSGSASQPAFVTSKAHVAGWSSALLESRDKLKPFMNKRGLTRATVKQFGIGWANHVQAEGGRTIARNAYTIPVYDDERKVRNTRFYDITPGSDRRKIWGVPDMNRPRLYPLADFLADDRDRVLICEGEWDALIARQEGFNAVTRTASATTWDMSWNPHFAGKRVYLVQDCDEAGQAGNRKLQRALRGVAASCVIVRLPYAIKKRHGKDLTDFFKDGYTAADLLELMDGADADQAPDQPVELDPTDASILETMDAARVGKPQRIVATVRGKSEPGYSIPRAGLLTCTMDRGEAACASCPLFGAGGKARVEIPPDDPEVLGLLDATKAQVNDIMRNKFGAKKCDRLTYETTEFQAVETLFVRPSVDHVQFSEARDFQSRKITSIGKHDTQTNTTVRITGALQPDPRRQRNEFQAWLVEEQETSIDKFEMTPDLLAKLAIFRPDDGQTPLSKRIEVARELAREVTGIHRRDEMHVAMDLSFHSVLAFVFDGQRIDRGWVELLVAGDTRTGKSECAFSLTRHYQVGEIVDCKAASFAGVVGGLQQFAGSSEYTVNWGVVPMNDRRLVVMEEAGGLTVEDIAKLSSVRSSGVAKITKIQQDSTSARTRLIWLANPRNNVMANYLYGVDALRPLIGNDEDVARFTLAMAVRKGEVPNDVINGPSLRTGQLKYTSDLCHSLVMWCWSRKREQVSFTKTAVAAVYKQATKLGDKYVESPPLIQAANVRVKIATVAAALAGATFSTEDGETLIVTRQHVLDAVKFIDHLYAMESFGYLERSLEARRDEKHAQNATNKAVAMLKANPGLRKFLRTQTRFKRQDIEEVLDYSREGSNHVIKQLHEMRMIRKQGGFIIVTATLHEILRKETSN